MIAKPTFRQQLAHGQVGESIIAVWLRERRGFTVLPVYDIEIETGKGPRLFAPDRKLIAPDMFVFRTPSPDHRNSASTMWIEAKHKTTFSWHRNTRCWTTGIDFRHYVDYCEIDDSTPWPVMLMFLQRGGRDKDTGKVSPSGLYGHQLSVLRKQEHHRSTLMGNGGMVFWSESTLLRLATMQEIESLKRRE